MREREQRIRAYFNAWIRKDACALEDAFADDVVYSECYGPVYVGLAQIRRWFSDWNQRGSVLEWTIRGFVHEGNTTVIDWYFRCDYEGVVGGFDGVSIAEFNDAGKIVRLREFEAKAEHVYPYAEDGKAGCEEETC